MLTDALEHESPAQAVRSAQDMFALMSRERTHTICGAQIDYYAPLKLSTFIVKGAIRTLLAYEGARARAVVLEVEGVQREHLKVLVNALALSLQEHKRGEKATLRDLVGSLDQNSLFTVFVDEGTDVADFCEPEKARSISVQELRANQKVCVELEFSGVTVATPKVDVLRHLLDNHADTSRHHPSWEARWRARLVQVHHTPVAREHVTLASLRAVHGFEDALTFADDAESQAEVESMLHEIQAIALTSSLPIKLHSGDDERADTPPDMAT